MTLKQEAKEILKASLGEEVARQIELFEDPERYPEDFINQCIFFLGKLIGNDNARKRFSPLIKKYMKGKKVES